MNLRNNKALPPDEVAQTLYDNGIIPEPTTNALYRALDKEKLRIRKVEPQRIEELPPGAQIEKTGDLNLQVGDKIRIASEWFEVKSRDENNIILSNGKTIKVDTYWDELPVEDIKRFSGERVKDIIKTSESMFLAQREIKAELGKDIDISTLKGLEVQIKGGAIGDKAEKIINDVVDSIRTKNPTIEYDYGVGEVANISPEEIIDSITFTDKIKELKKSEIEKITRLLHQIELTQVYLYSYPDSKPITEGVIDEWVRQLKLSKDIDIAEDKINKADHKPEIAQLLAKLDKDERLTGKTENVITYVNKYISEGKFTQNDKEAIRSFGELRKIKKAQIIMDILESRAGVRVKSKGIRYNIKFIKKSGGFPWWMLYRYCLISRMI